MSDLSSLNADQNEIPADIMKAAEKAFKYGFGLRYAVAIEAIAKAIHAERQSDQWQTMETAPRDGTAVDLWAYRGECGGLGYRDGDRYPDCRFARRHFGTEPYGEPVWLGLNDQHIKVTPTHWRPLPAPPLSPRTVSTSEELGEGSAIISNGGSDHG